MKSVMITIPPKQCGSIVRGEQTIVVKKTRPKLPTPFVAYIYCPKNGSFMIQSKTNPAKQTNRIQAYGGKVIGEFVCDDIGEFYVFENSTVQYWNYLQLEKTCLTYDEIANYIGKNKYGYSWHISNLVIYDKPRELSDFYRECEESKCDDCPHLHFENTPYSYEGWCVLDEKIPITRPPQSWCYIETDRNAYIN